jgi:hypothetical protein
MKQNKKKRKREDKEEGTNGEESGEDFEKAQMRRNYSTLLRKRCEEADGRLCGGTALPGRTVRRKRCKEAGCRLRGGIAVTRRPLLCTEQNRKPR